MQILVVEDDSEMAQFLEQGLSQAGHETTVLQDGDSGYQAAVDNDYDVLILDRMLPRQGGLSILKKLREQEDHTPVLILSALGEVDHRVEGLQMGADDYLAKPFSFVELTARIDALYRRDNKPEESPTLEVADLTLDLIRHRAFRSGKSIKLVPLEYKLLEYMMRHAGQVVTQAMLLENVWNLDFDPQTNVVVVHISHLRRKIDKGFDQALIHTVRGSGYVIRDPASADS